jgi:DNA-binding NarL/FixJ family response regulator
MACVQDPGARPVALTRREQEVMAYLAAGKPNKVVAIELGISLRTAEAHRARVFSKMGVRNAMELACRLCVHARSACSPVLGSAPDERQE